MRAINSKWQLLRSVTAVDNPVLGATTMDSKPSFAKDIASDAIGGIELFAAGIGDENGTIVANIWAGKGNGGPARLVAAVTFTLGTMQVNKDPQTQEATDLTWYADTAAVTAYWPSEVKTPNNAVNKLATVSFDALDHDWIAIEIVTLTNVTKANVYLGYFE